MKPLALLLLCLPLFAQITLIDLHNAPKGHVRNFFIWQYMQQEINATQAEQAYTLVDGYNTKIKSLYLKKTDNVKALAKNRCQTLTVKEMLLENNTSCINQSISIAGALKLQSTQRLRLSEKLKQDFPDKSDLLKTMNQQNFLYLLLKENPKEYLVLFNRLSRDERVKFMNIKIPPDRMNSLANQKGFDRAVKLIVTDDGMSRMQASLLVLEPHDFSHQTYFFLALNALRFKATKRAMNYLDVAHKLAYYRIDKDKVLFWQYQISQSKTYLAQLSQSDDINIYTLFAKEQLKLPTSNYYTDLELENKPSQIDLNNPYVWEHLLSEIRSSDDEALKAMLAQYNTQDDEVLHAFIYSRLHHYKTHNFIMPYQNATHQLDNDTQAMIYALARQESHFIPSAISRSFALGVMQMMPFLVRHLAKKEGEKVQLETMFDPDKNMHYAKQHLAYLQKYLYHPLFIAYAYNGGIGFTKRYLLKGNFLPGSFEPYLSMELMANAESREYGKKVLANYVIYKKILGEEVTIVSLFENLTEPSRTDRFRTKALALKH